LARFAALFFADLLGVLWRNGGMFLRRPPAFVLTILLFGVLTSPFGYAGGPRWVAGTSYFDPATTGRPIIWKNGVLNYYIDLGNLSPTRHPDAGQRDGRTGRGDVERHPDSGLADQRRG
jgi:hypothetical protein